MPRSLLIQILSLVLIAGCTERASETVPPMAPGNINWPGHSNSPDESGYSPLTEIHRGNVAELGLAWSLDLPGEQTLESTPIQVDGVIYFTGSTADVYAVDALSGYLEWGVLENRHWRRPLGWPDL